MEESLNIEKCNLKASEVEQGCMQKEQECTEKNPEQMNALALAYLGDAVFELMIRRQAMLTGSCKVEKLHKKVTGLVNAASQSNFVRKLEPYFTEEEQAVYHRGRNAKTITAAKHQSITDYRRATGLEAVFGYLYLKQDQARINELLKLCMESLETQQ